MDLDIADRSLEKKFGLENLILKPSSFIDAISRHENGRDHFGGENVEKGESVQD